MNSVFDPTDVIGLKKDYYKYVNFSNKLTWDEFIHRYAPVFGLAGNFITIKLNRRESYWVNRWYGRLLAVDMIFKDLRVLTESFKLLDDEFQAIDGDLKVITIKLKWSKLHPLVLNKKCKNYGNAYLFTDELFYNE